MKKLLVLLMLFWYSVPALPWQANTIAGASQSTLHQEVDSDKKTAVALLFQDYNIPGPEALPQLEKSFLLPAVQGKQLLVTYTSFDKAATSALHFSIRPENGGHIIFTAGP
ncbi:hypothetical protein [Pontibacter pudoricolor]|uniref:hypothetical protein n=1 Tax=Pontibacter pudoricolor TaxID=2694930 RepID=UPI0013918964|nr:hypothetical protein [Pontibacter pudoricolor]